MLPCCKAELHPWDYYKVAAEWLPQEVRCFIIGENPGNTNSEYFYSAPGSYDRDRVRVRRGLLQGLHNGTLVSEATLEGFRNAGFLFDHAIRCLLPREI